MAFAAGDVNGVVQRIDRSTRKIFLTDGRTYTVVRGIDLAKFGPGEHVALRTEGNRDREVVIKMIKGDAFPFVPLDAPKQQSRRSL
jgi:hypothetical protein